MHHKLIALDTFFAGTSTLEERFSRIKMDLERHEAMILSPFACRNEEAVLWRREPEIVPSSRAFDLRSVFQVDQDRVEYSDSSARLKGKTQVYWLVANDHISRRMDHVKKVVNITGELCQILGLNVRLGRAIAQGHDNGHSAFGHNGEMILNAICKDKGIGAFIHSAQSVRWLVEIEGRNLTLQTIDGILCHNGEIISDHYLPHYGKTLQDIEREYRACMEEYSAARTLVPGTLEGAVMRISDVIAYVGQDLYDAAWLNVLDARELPDEVIRIFQLERILEKPQYDTLDRAREVNSQLIKMLINDLVAQSIDRDHLRLSKPIYAGLQTLKKFNETKIYLNPQIKFGLPEIETMFSSLFERYLNDLLQKNSSSNIFLHFLNRTSNAYQQKNPPERIVIDFISGMTDAYLIDHFPEIKEKIRLPGYSF